MTADGYGSAEIMRRTGKAKTAVWRWQERFMQAGVEGLLRDKTRPSRIPPLAPEVAERLVDRTLGEAGRDLTLNGARHGTGQRDQRQFGAAHLARARAPAAPGPPLKAVQ